MNWNIWCFHSASVEESGFLKCGAVKGWSFPMFQRNMVFHLQWQRCPRRLEDEGIVHLWNTWKLWHSVTSWKIWSFILRTFHITCPTHCHVLLQNWFMFSLIDTSWEFLTSLKLVHTHLILVHGVFHELNKIPQCCTVAFSVTLWNRVTETIQNRVSEVVEGCSEWRIRKLSEWLGRMLNE
jgi:hypothetical protein